jgi:hypothetical protein
VGDPSNTNAQLLQTRLPNGNASAGFGYINALSTPTGTETANRIDLSPRSGTLVARFTF